MTNLHEVEQYLQSLGDRDHATANDDRFVALLARLKSDAVRQGDEATAKQIWCYEQIHAIQEHYLLAFHQLKQGSYYDAWCLFEQIEIALHSLERHYNSDTDRFRIRFITEHTRRYQSLFPYKVFISPEFLVHEETCSICQKPVSIRNPCAHRVGEIYAGEECCRIVNKADLLGTAIVQNPVQKYSVLSLADPKSHADFPLLRYLIKRLSNPFDAWRMEWSHRRQPHSRFGHIGRNDPCPCNSGKKYKKCCLPEQGVMRPHCEFIFSVPPPKELQASEYID